MANSLSGNIEKSYIKLRESFYISIEIDRKFVSNVSHETEE